MRCGYQRKMMRIGRGALTLVLLVPTGAACGLHGIQTAAPCAELSSPAAASAATGDPIGRTAVLFDVSDSTRSANGDLGGPDYVSAVTDDIDNALERQDAVSVGSFSGTAAVTWKVFDVRSRWKADNPDPDNQQAELATAQECLRNDAQAAASASPNSSGTDILSAIRSAAQWLSATPGAKHLVVATDGLVTQGCASLTESDFSNSAEISGIKNVCAGSAKEVWPKELAGIDVTLVGIGQTAPGHPTPTAAKSTWLAQLWQTLCAAAGATASDSGSCTVSQSVPAVIAARAQSTSTAHTDTPIDFGDGRRTLYWVPAATLFDTGSPSIHTSADAVLAQIAVQIRTTPTTSVTVYGYVDPRGSAANNVTLAQSRADAVKSALEAYGVSKITAKGQGVPTSCPYQLPAHATQDDIYQCQRRVDIVVAGKEGP